MSTLGCKDGKPTPIDLDIHPETPILFAEGKVSTSLYERDIAISADGDEIIFTLGNYKQSFRSLVSIKKEAGRWGKKQILPFSGKYNDIEPFLSVDGQQLFFASTRPVDADTTRTDYNIWVANRSDASWGEPIPLDTLINSKNDEFYPAVSKNGNLYFTATREKGFGREDIFLSERINGKYQAAVPLDSTINSAVFEFNAYISPEEDLLIFSSFGRADGLGGGDLYYSKRDKNGVWKAAKNMGAQVNSENLDYCPFIDLPRKNFYFTSDRAENVKEVRTVGEFTANAHKTLNGMGNIYMVNLDSLELN
ncbi:MAG: PD40 domain-containing protein [Eudoraea sp.]|nr:PD40 domain-containing protein [Eudoraea sp.]